MYTRISLCVCAHGVKSETSLDTGVCVKQSSPATHFLCSTARIRKDISAAWYFCSCKFLWRNDECVLLVLLVNMFYYPVLTRSLIFLQLWTAAS